MTVAFLLFVIKASRTLHRSVMLAGQDAGGMGQKEKECA
jgi:hypothetical protein